MAIGTNAQIEVFGSQDTLGTSASTVANDAFSVAGDLSTWTNDDNAPFASVILSASYATPPTAGTVVHLYARLLNIYSTGDQEVPSANLPHTYMGSFPLSAVSTAQFIPIDVILPNTAASQQYEFYIHNVGGQTLGANWDLYITPKTIGPA